MLSGTVLFVHRNSMGASSVEKLITSEHPRIHVEKASSGAEALTIQAVMRPEVIVMEMEQPDMTGEHLISEMKRDIARPFVVVCMEKCTAQERRKIMKMGADEILQGQADIVRMSRKIEEQMSRRAGNGGMGLPEAAMQRLFVEMGVPFDLKGYRYLKYALMLLNEGAASLTAVRDLYEQIGEKYGCMPATVERDIRYAVGLCGSRMDGNCKMTNRAFLALLMEQQGTLARGLCSPRVSVFCSGRRLFR